jgi:hypothetical protein
MEKKNIIDYIYPPRKNIPYQNKTKTPELQVCFRKVVTDCAAIKNYQCVCLNNNRQTLATNYETIEVGLQLPNSEGQLIRFIPRYVKIVTYMG